MEERLIHFSPSNNLPYFLSNSEKACRLLKQMASLFLRVDAIFIPLNCFVSMGWVI